VASLKKVQAQVYGISLEIRTLTQKIIFKPISVVEIEHQKKQLTEVLEELKLYQKDFAKKSSEIQAELNNQRKWGFAGGIVGILLNAKFGGSDIGTNQREQEESDESRRKEIESELKIFESCVDTSIQKCESLLQEAEEYLKQPEKIEAYLEAQRAYLEAQKKDHRDSMTFFGTTFSIVGASILLFAGASKHLNAFNVILGSTTGVGGLVMLSQRKSYKL